MFEIEFSRKAEKYYRSADGKSRFGMKEQEKKEFFIVRPSLPTNDTKYTKLYSCLFACFVGNMLLLKAT